MGPREGDPITDFDTLFSLPVGTTLKWSRRSDQPGRRWTVQLHEGHYVLVDSSTASRHALGSTRLDGALCIAELRATETEIQEAIQNLTEGPT